MFKVYLMLAAMVAFAAAKPLVVAPVAYSAAYTSPFAAAYTAPVAAAYTAPVAAAYTAPLAYSAYSAYAAPYSAAYYVR